MCYIRNERVTKHPIGRNEYAKKGKHSTHAYNFCEGANQHQPR
jgi:hypothetical protein